MKYGRNDIHQVYSEVQQYFEVAYYTPIIIITLVTIDYPPFTRTHYHKSPIINNTARGRKTKQKQNKIQPRPEPNAKAKPLNQINPGAGLHIEYCNARPCLPDLEICRGQPSTYLCANGPPSTPR